MKIKTEEDLIEKLDEDFAWRRKELTSIYADIDLATTVKLNSQLRIGITILYAHWEGFIKNAADLYLNYIAIRKLKYCDLSPCFLALSLRKKLIDYQDTYKALSHIKLIEFMKEGMDERASIPYNNIIKTNSNLNFETLAEILCLIGLDYRQYEVSEFLINKRLVEQRNSIAHGQFLSVDKSDFEKLYNEIFRIMNDIKDKIIYSVENGSYRI